MKKGDKVKTNDGYEGVIQEEVNACEGAYFVWIQVPGKNGWIDKYFKWQLTPIEPETWCKVSTGLDANREPVNIVKLRGTFVITQVNE